MTIVRLIRVAFLIKYAAARACRQDHFPGYVSQRAHTNVASVYVSIISNLIVPALMWRFALSGVALFPRSVKGCRIGIPLFEFGHARRGHMEFRSA